MGTLNLFHHSCMYLCYFFLLHSVTSITVMFLSFQTDRSGQTVQTQIRLLLEEQSDLGLHCLPFLLHLFGQITLRNSHLVQLLG